MKTIFRLFLYLSIAFNFLNCSEDSPATPKIKPVIEADRYNTGFNDEVSISLMIDGKPAEGYNCNWNSEIGEIISGNGSSQILWRSPGYANSGELSVTVDGENLESPTNIVLTSVAPFYDNFSGNDKNWLTNYLNVWKGEDNCLHLKGASYENVGLMYSRVNSESMDKYSFSTRLAPIASDYQYFEYGVYFKTRDTAVVNVLHEGVVRELEIFSFIFIFTNFYTDVNFYTMGYTELDGERKWVYIDANLVGFDDEITIEFNHFLDLEWVMHPDKLLQVKVNGREIATSFVFQAAEYSSGRVFDFFPDVVGLRTVHTTELAVEEIKVTDLNYNLSSNIPVENRFLNRIKIKTLDDYQGNSVLLRNLKNDKFELN